MMHVTQVAEPADFDDKVRQPGLRWLCEKLGGERTSRTGRPVKPLELGKPLVATRLRDYWTACLPDLEREYGVCAYACLKIREGGGTVDHFECKDRCLADDAKRGRIYEWDNFRYAFWRVNQHKGTRDVLDPFKVNNDWFALEFVGLTVHPRGSLPVSIRGDILKTIEFAGLNNPWLVRLRSEYFEDWRTRRTTFDYLVEYAPFIASEISRQEITVDYSGGSQ